MKPISAIIHLFVLILLPVGNCYAQSLSEMPDVTRIEIEKQGKLDKLIKATNAQGAKKLSIVSTGNEDKAYLNEKDLKKANGR